MKRLLQGASAAAVSMALAMPAYAQVEEIVVTATKRSENAQDIAVAVKALGTESLDELGVDQFTDYLKQLPSVTSGGAGPGQSTIYIRGVASTTPNPATAGVSGLAPNVALYLDEQPLSQPGRNLDVYAVDLERIEVLAGPQGTLFGASSQAGTVRLITNKPKIGEFQAFANGGMSFTKGGDPSFKAEGGINIPIGGAAAIRIVGYTDTQGGYIDNVAGTRDLRASGRFRAAGTLRPNGTRVETFRAGFDAGESLAGVTFRQADNAALVEDNFNDTTYAGFRATGRVELGPDFTVTAGYAKQFIDSEGVFFDDPSLGDYKIQRFSEETIDDDFENFNWTVEGRLGFLEMLYTGAFTKRKAKQLIDYTDYLFGAQYLPYYLCDSGVSYSYAAAPSGTCYAPNTFVDSTTRTEVMTHEFRVNTPVEKRIRATLGGFYSDLEVREFNNFNYPNNVFADVFGSGGGFSPNRGFTSGYISDTGVFDRQTIFRNDIRRTDKQYGFFGEASFDIIPDKLTLTGGARYYNVEVDLEGGANSSFCNSFQADSNSFGTDISDLYDGDGKFRYNRTCNTARTVVYTLGSTFNAATRTVTSIANLQAIDSALSLAEATRLFNSLIAPDKAKTSGFIFKGNLSYKPTDDLLFYLTYSEGFRPGLLNRPGGTLNRAGNFTVPFEVDTDNVTNYEFGFKTDLVDNQLRLNGSLFYVDIKNLQTTLFDPNISNLFFSANAADARVYGLEADFTIAPRSIEGLTVAGAVSVLDTKITDVLIPTGDVIVGKELAFAPNFQGNIRARYEWALNENLTAHIQPQVVYAGSSRSDIIEFAATKVDSWTAVALSAGLKGEHWNAELFADNLFDTTGALSATAQFGPITRSPLRPRTVGLRVGFKY